MMTTSDKLRQLAQALKDASMTIDPYEHEYALDMINAVIRDLEALAGQFDAARTCQEVVHDAR